MSRRQYTILASYVDEDGKEVETRVDEETGELKDYIVNESIPRDIQYPSPVEIHRITGRKAFEELLSEKIGRRKYQLWVGNVLLDLAIDKDIHASIVTVFCFLGRKVGYNNIAYTSTKELVEGTGLNKRTVQRALDSLERMHLILKVVLDLDKAGDRLILINPRYFFLGYYPYRQVLVREWS